MIKLRIDHKTVYQYTNEVFLEPHHFYFYPTARPNVKVIDFDISTRPEPSGITQRIDQENNLYHQAWFLGMHSRLSIESVLEVEIAEINPFSFLIEESPKTPFTQPMQIYAAQSYELGKDLSEWSSDICASSSAGILDYLSHLVKTISDDWDHQTRYEFDLMDPTVCFSDKRGSCRDLSWMMIQILRKEGFPARFVSGYAFNPDLGEGHELHAWVEVWLHGGGWVALDPSAGIFCNENYLPVSASYHPFNTLPVIGSYRGDAVSNLETEVKITKI